MTEERFVGCEDSNGLKSIFDNQDKENEPLLFNCIGEVDVIVDLLNKQDKTIKFLRYLLGYYYDKDEIDKMIMDLI